MSHAWRRFKIVLLGSVLAGSCGCASSEKEPVSKSHRATVVNDLFQVEQGMPIREVQKDKEFFFKRCEQLSAWPHFTKTEYECTELP